MHDERQDLVPARRALRLHGRLRTPHVVELSEDPPEVLIDLEVEAKAKNLAVARLAADFNLKIKDKFLD
jgi:hypothetical protein